MWLAVSTCRSVKTRQRAGHRNMTVGGGQECWLAGAGGLAGGRGREEECGRRV